MEHYLEDGSLPSDELEIAGGTNVLLLASPMSETGLDVCLDLLSTPEPADVNVWSLGFTVSPDHRVKNWEGRVGERPAEFRIVTVGNLAQASAEDVAERHGFDPAPHFVTVPHGGDLTRIGIEFTRTLQEWADSPDQTVVCFHSLTALIQYASVQQAFRFLNSFTAHVESGGAIAHYHMDPDAHEDRTLAKITHLFDTVIETDANGGWTVTKR